MTYPMRALFFLGLVVGQGLSLAATTQPSFRDRRDYPTEYYDRVTTGDVNGDGIVDLIGGSYTKGVAVFLGNGDGTFRVVPIISNLGGLNDPFSLTTLDVNGDGKLDLVMGSSPETPPNFYYGISVALGNGDGTFSPAVFYPADVSIGNFFVHAAVGDFNKDNIPDVVIVGAAGVWFYEGHRDGTFSTPVLTPLADGVNSYSESLVVADVNGDGNMDVIAVDGEGYAVLLGNGKGVFTAKEYQTPGSPTDLAIGDMNGDGHPDLAMVSVAFGNYAYLLFGKGDGTFGSPAVTVLPGQTVVRAADLNNDGILDLISDVGYIDFGKGDGTFQSPTYFPIASPLGPGFDADDVKVADLLGNGSLDIVTANQTDSLSVLINRGDGSFYDGKYMTTPIQVLCSATGDFNGDGIMDLLLDGEDEAYVFFGTGKEHEPFTQGPAIPLINYCPAVGDVNGDGILDLVVPYALTPSTGTITTFLGNGDGTFTQSAVLKVNVAATDAVLADFNGDGKLDIASTANLIAFGNGDGSFGHPEPLATLQIGQYLTSFATADVNGDGKPDLVSSDAANGQYYTLINNGNGTFKFNVFTGAEACLGGLVVATADLNGDGNVDLAFVCGLAYINVFLGKGDGTFRETPLLSLKPHAVPGPIVISDLNGDGIPDIGVVTSNSFGVLLGNGDGTFQAARRWFGLGPSPETPFAMNLRGQAPGSGLPDIVVPDASGLLGILVNTTK